MPLNGKRFSTIFFDDIIEEVEKLDGCDDTVKDVIDSMTEKQKNIMYYIISRAMEDYGMCNGVHVKKVIFNRPATIVFFEDGTKVVAI